MGQSFVQNLQHIVFSTKNRDKWIDESWEKELHAYIGGILRGIDCSMKAAGGGLDHIHILASINKNLTLPDVISILSPLQGSPPPLHPPFPGLRPRL